MDKARFAWLLALSFATPSFGQTSTCASLESREHIRTVEAIFEGQTTPLMEEQIRLATSLLPPGLETAALSLAEIDEMSGGVTMSLYDIEDLGERYRYLNLRDLDGTEVQYVFHLDTLDLVPAFYVDEECFEVGTHRNLPLPAPAPEVQIAPVQCELTSENGPYETLTISVPVAEGAMIGDQGELSLNGDLRGLTFDTQLISGEEDSEVWNLGFQLIDRAEDGFTLNSWGELEGGVLTLDTIEYTGRLDPDAESTVSTYDCDVPFQQVRYYL